MAAIRAPITGTVWRLLAAAGQTVRAGEEVAILESMKLEIPVEADGDGTIARVLVGEGDAVVEGDPLFALE